MDEKLIGILLEAITNDDLKKFDSCMEKAPCGTFRYGRFPVLSLLYLYNARKIISAYEDKFIKYNNWQELREPAAVTAEFRKVAGKCLRIYLEEVVTPAEMLLILDKTAKLKKIYPSCRPSAAVKQRLKDIYSIKYALNVDFSGDDIILDKRPLTRKEKNRILTAVISATLCAAIIICTPFVVNVFVPFIGAQDYEKPDTPPQGTDIDTPKPDEIKTIEVSSYEEIDFSSKNTFILTNNIEISAENRVEKLNCTLDGNGRSISCSGGEPLFEEINGSLKNVTFSTDGSPIIGTVNPKATVENVTVSVNSDREINASSSFFTITNYGSVTNIGLKAKGSLRITEGTDVIFGGIIGTNGRKEVPEEHLIYNGIVTDCTAEYEDFHISGTVTANASFGGIVGDNGYAIKNCTVKGKIISDTTDVAGICVNNDYGLLNCVNNAELSQTSAEYDWNPIVAGITVNNRNAVEQCENFGALTAVSTAEKKDGDENEPTASAAGIAYYAQSDSSLPVFNECKNNGAIRSSAQNRTTYAAGICALLAGQIKYCGNYADVSSESGILNSYAGGCAAQSYGYVWYSVNYGTVSISSKEGEGFIGGISAYGAAQISVCLSKGNVSANSKICRVGGILGYSAVNTSSFGTVINSICSATITVTAETDSFVGGIIGFIDELVANEGTAKEIYLGGGVNTSYFAGEKPVITGNATFGAIAGACGKHIHDKNEYVSGLSIAYHFNANYTLDFTTAVTAIGKLFTKTDNSYTYIAGDNLGTSVATLKTMESDEVYVAIMKALETLIKTE